MFRYQAELQRLLGNLRQVDSNLMLYPYIPTNEIISEDRAQAPGKILFQYGELAQMWRYWCIRLTMLQTPIKQHVLSRLGRSCATPCTQASVFTSNDPEQILSLTTPMNGTCLANRTASLQSIPWTGVRSPTLVVMRLWILMAMLEDRTQPVVW